VEPNKKTTYRIALLIGLVLPVAFIYLRDLFNDKVRTREDIMKRTSIPIVGEISHIKKLNLKVLPALRQDLTGEQFRMIRSNIALLQKHKDKLVILITSTTSGEGKSFISLNLAAVFAKAGKRVALLEFDLRKPHDKNLTVDQSTGITDYLTGHIPLQETGQQMKDIPGLHIFPAGPFISDPADLLLDEKVTLLFAQMKHQYDVVVVNSAPAGLVSDAQVLAQYADMVLYVIRQEHTNKQQIGFIDDLFRTQKLSNMGLVFNDVRTGVKYGYEGYGYSKGNPYYRGPLNGQKKSVWSKMKNTVGIS
jgi:capsular exopolysaccharide synthesis family protein